MKTTSHNPNIFYVALLLVSTVGFAQETKETAATINNKVTNISTMNNPYFLNNELEGEIASELVANDEMDNETYFLLLESNALKTRHETAKNSISNVR